MTTSLTVKIPGDKIATVFVYANAGCWQKCTLRGAIERTVKSERDTHGTGEMLLRELIQGPASVDISSQHSPDGGDTWRDNDVRLLRTNDNEIVVGCEDGADSDYNDISVVFDLTG